MIIRDSKGNCIACATFWFVGMFQVKGAEAISLMEALSWIKNKRLQNVIFETDSRVVSNVIQERSSLVNEFGSIVNSCLDLSSHNPSYSVAFVGRKDNEVAHRLTRMSKFYASPMYWNEPPGFILPLLLTDNLQ